MKKVPLQSVPYLFLLWTHVSNDIHAISKGDPVRVLEEKCMLEIKKTFLKIIFKDKKI